MKSILHFSKYFYIATYDWIMLSEKRLFIQKNFTNMKQVIKKALWFTIFAALYILKVSIMQVNIPSQYTYSIFQLLRLSLNTLNTCTITREWQNRSASFKLRSLWRRILVSYGLTIAFKLNNISWKNSKETGTFYVCLVCMHFLKIYLKN